jgi:hypothetical protein
VFGGIGELKEICLSIAAQAGENFFLSFFFFFLPKVENPISANSAGFTRCMQYSDWNVYAIVEDMLLV